MSIGSFEHRDKQLVALRKQRHTNAIPLAMLFPLNPEHLLHRPLLESGMSPVTVSSRVSTSFVILTSLTTVDDSLYSILLRKGSTR